MTALARVYHPVFGLLTRPPMVWGITLESFGVVALLSLSFFILSSNPLYILIYVPLHALCFVGCQWDVNFFKVMQKKTLCAYCPNRKLWGAPCYGPF